MEPESTPGFRNLPVRLARSSKKSKKNRKKIDNVVLRFPKKSKKNRFWCSVRFAKLPKKMIFLFCATKKNRKKIEKKSKKNRFSNIVRNVFLETTRYRKDTSRSFHRQQKMRREGFALVKLASLVVDISGWRQIWSFKKIEKTRKKSKKNDFRNRFFRF